MDDEPANRRFVSRVLADARWDVFEAEDGDEAIAAAQSELPDLIVMDIDMPRVDGWAATEAIRAAQPPLASVAILAYTTMRIDDAEIVSRGMDGRLPKPTTPDALVEAVARWRPNGELAGARRLIDVFGKEELGSLIARFRAQLSDALALLDADAADVPAHRIAGVAGTLGFADVSDSWLALSEGETSMRDQARRDARLAIAGIDREWGD